MYAFWGIKSFYKDLMGKTISWGPPSLPAHQKQLLWTNLALLFVCYNSISKITLFFVHFYTWKNNDLALLNKPIPPPSLFNMLLLIHFHKNSCIITYNCVHVLCYHDCSQHRHVLHWNTISFLPQITLSHTLSFNVI